MDCLRNAKHNRTHYSDALHSFALISVYFLFVISFNFHFLSFSRCCSSHFYNFICELFVIMFYWVASGNTIKVRVYDLCCVRLCADVILVHRFMYNKCLFISLMLLLMLLLLRACSNFVLVVLFLSLIKSEKECFVHHQVISSNPNITNFFSQQQIVYTFYSRCILADFSSYLFMCVYVYECVRYKYNLPN